MLSGIFGTIVKKGFNAVKQYESEKNAPKYLPPPPKKKDYTPAIIGAVGVLLIAGIILKNNKK